MRKTSIGLCLFLLTGCASPLYVPKQTIPSQNATQLAEGRALYATSCSNCHALFLPNQFTPTQWAINLEKMQERAKITSTQKQLIYEYLVNAPKK